MWQIARRMGVHGLILWTCFVISGNSLAYGKLEPPAEQWEMDTMEVDTPGSILIRSTQVLDTEFALTSGFRTDNLNWSIAGHGINVLSELEWSNVLSYQFSLENRTQFKNNIYFKAKGNYGFIQDGTVRDSDYGADYHNNEWSRSISESKGDEVMDLSAGAGYSFFYLKRRLAVAPMLGFSYHKQNLRIKNGWQIVSKPNPFNTTRTPSEGPLPSGLDSSYFAKWTGAWLGCDLRFKPQMQQEAARYPMELRLSMALHWTEYYGEGNWNLRDDLKHPKSFEHEANGTGVSISGQCLVQLAEKWHLTLTVDHRNWNTGSGTDRKFLAEGGTASTRLNKVNWQSTSFMMGAAYRF